MKMLVKGAKLLISTTRRNFYRLFSAAIHPFIRTFARLKPVILAGFITLYIFTDEILTMTERLRSEMESLPIGAICERLNETLRREQAVIVTAAPGAGKSTVLPLTVLEVLPPDAGKIIMLEPRRVAARQVASRMAWLLGEPVGKTVGYRVRFESKVSADTRIEVVTEGILTRMLLDDPALEGVGAVVFDEFHERSLNADEALALVRQTQSLLRDDLRLLLMSATINASALAATLHCPVLESEGRMYPVELVYTSEETDPRNVAQLTARVILQAHRTHEGDILAFLPGEWEIRRTAELLTGALGSTSVYPLYGQLPADEQARAIAPSRHGERRVVLATPIAETSLTIEGVRVVVDSGLCRKMVFDARSGLNHLETVRISQDMAAQRAGRAGRVAPGVCYRLWSLATEHRMQPMRTPEILEADLTSLVLDAALWGEREVEQLPWITPPPRERVIRGRTLLQSLGALDGEGRASELGKALSRLPCHPRIARMLLMADKPGQRMLAADIAALLEEKDPLAAEADTSMSRRLDALRSARRSGRPGSWGRILRIARQYADIIHASEDNSAVNPYEVGQLLASAYPERIGKAWSQATATFQLSGGDLVAVDPADPMSAADWLVAASMHRKAGGVGRLFLASVVDPADLCDHAVWHDNISWDAKTGAVVARREQRIGAILLSSKPLAGDVSDAVQTVVCEAIAREGPSLLNFSADVQSLQRRIGFVAERHPELCLPEVDTPMVCRNAPAWGPLFVGKATTAAELKRIDLCAVVWSLLDYEQQRAVERLAPTHVVVPTGSRIRLDYRQGAEVPVLKVRLQECFGLLDTPLVDGTPVLMELLSPGFKPVQLTSDLRSFWSNAYFEVRKELRRRYPKHSWPDNPLEATPVRGVQRLY